MKMDRVWDSPITERIKVRHVLKVQQIGKVEKNVTGGFCRVTCISICVGAE